MNSLIISGIISFLRAFASAFSGSGLWRLIERINSFFKRSWQQSGIVNFAEGRCASFDDSLFSKIIFSPFAFLEFVRDRLHKPLGAKVRSSVICEAGRVYVESFMALNTRFWGLTVFGAAITWRTLNAIRHVDTNIIVTVLIPIAILVALTDVNVTQWLGGSKIVEFCKACAGVRDIRFDFFDEARTHSELKFVAAISVGVVMGAIMAFMPLYGLLIPFALFGMLLVLRFPVTGVYAAVFIAPLIPFSSMPLAGVCLWTLLSLVIKSIIDEKFTWKRDALGAVLMLFLAVLLVSCVFSFARASSLKVWAMYLIFVSFYFAIENTISTREQLYGLLRLFVISGAAVALYGVMQYAFGWTTTNAWIDETMFEDDTMRVFSTLANPNVLGEYLLLVLPVSATFFLKDKARTLSKWVYLAVTGLIFICLILTQSRGCWLGFFLAVVLFITFYEGRLWALVPFALILLPLVMPQTIADRLGSIGDMDDSSTSYRVYIWMGAIGLLRHYLAGGIGMGEGAFNEVYPFFSYNAIIAPHAHNTYLQLLVEGGIPALAVFLAVIVVYIRSVRSVYKVHIKKSLDSTMALAIGVGMCGFLFQSLFDYTFYNYRVMAVFFMLMGITAASRYIIAGETTAERGVKKT